jgi:hypothetical protein
MIVSYRITSLDLQGAADAARQDDNVTLRFRADFGFRARCVVHHGAGRARRQRGIANNQWGAFELTTRPPEHASNVDGLSVGDPSRPTEITLTAIDAATGGRTILRLRQLVTYTRLEPYGKGCGWQYRSYHTLTSTGTLVDAQPTTQPK